MTAGLVTGSATANTDVRFDRPEANLNVGKVRSSVEITDSCNCFKWCPCIGGRKIVKQKQDNHIGTVEIARSALEDGPVRHQPIVNQNFTVHNEAKSDALAEYMIRTSNNDLQAYKEARSTSIPAKKKDLHPDWNKPISHPHITVDVHISQDLDVEQAKEVQKGNFS